MHKYSLFKYLRKYFRETLLATCFWLIYELFDHLEFEQAWSILWPALVFGTNKAVPRKFLIDEKFTGNVLEVVLPFICQVSK